MKSSFCLKIYFSLGIFIAFSLISNVSAIIGENDEQSDLRYGVAIKKEQDLSHYKKDGYDIKVHYCDGLTDNVTYTKFTRDKRGVLEGISFEEIVVLLDNNSRGEEWKGLEKQYKVDNPKERMWVCKKLPIQAYYEDENRTMTVLSTDNKKLKEIYLKRSKVNHEKLLNTLGI